MRRYYFLASVGVLALIIGAFTTACGLSAQQPAASKATAPSVMIGEGSLARVYKSLGELKGASTLIVVGTVTKQRVVMDDPPSPNTLSTFAVARTVWSKGAQPQTIDVRQMGGTAPDGTRWISRDFPALQIGGHYLLFLTPGQNTGQYYPVGAFQGVFAIDVHQSVNPYTADAAHLGVGASISDVPLDQFVQSIQLAPAVSVGP
jgi:hypothetical protein